MTFYIKNSGGQSSKYFSCVDAAFDVVQWIWPDSNRSFSKDDEEKSYRMCSKIFHTALYKENIRKHINIIINNNQYQ